MIIPNKYSGYQAGIRVYPLGGGGGGGGGEPGPAPVAPPPPRLPSAAPAPAFQTYGQGDRTGSLVQSGAGMRPSQLDYSRPIYDPNYKDNITGYEQSSQFYQPIYQPQYQNYANPYTAFNVSTYGTQPMMSTAAQYQANTGGSQQNVSNSVNNHLQQNPNADMNTMQAAMRGAGMNAYDVQGAGGFNNYGPQMSMPQMQTPFNPYTNNFGGGFMPQRQQFMPQMQTPFSSGMSQPAPQRTSSGPAQAIVGRSSQMRGTPNVMRRAQGGITSLLDET